LQKPPRDFNNRLVYQGSALGPIGGLSARQFNGWLPCRDEKREERERDIVNCLQDVMSGILLKLSLATTD